MAEYDDREHFIPLRKNDVIELLLRQPELPATHRDNFAQFCKLVIATYHFEFHDTLEDLKNAYAPFDPDADTHPLDPPTDEEKAQREKEVFEKLEWLMGQAKFEKKSEEDIEKALEGTSEGGINMDIDLKVFEEGKWMIFARGDTKEKKTVRRWWKLWKEETIEEELWRRLVIVFKLQPHKRLSRNIDFSKIYVRVYKDIPKMDLETLFPGATPQMRLIDKGKVSIPLLSGAGIVGSKLAAVGFTALLATLVLDWSNLEAKYHQLHALETALLAGGTGLLLLGFLGYAFRTYTSYMSMKTKYALQLSENLYYQTLDGNAGTLFRLLDEAEEQECREAILGYYFLWLKAGKDGWTSEELDDHIEEFIEAKTGVLIDFEIHGALEKLLKLRVIEKLPGGTYRAQPIEKALEMLDWTWDNYFKYNNPEPETPPIPAQVTA